MAVLSFCQQALRIELFKDIEAGLETDQAIKKNHSRRDREKERERHHWCLLESYFLSLPKLILLDNTIHQDREHEDETIHELRARRSYSGKHCNVVFVPWWWSLIQFCDISSTIFCASSCIEEDHVNASWTLCVFFVDALRTCFMKFFASLKAWVRQCPSSSRVIALSESQKTFSACSAW